MAGVTVDCSPAEQCAPRGGGAVQVGGFRRSAQDGGQRQLVVSWAFADEWATDLNRRGPEGVKAGHYGKEVAWRCAAGHVWHAKVSDRITRLLRCQRCSTRRADETNSLAVIYPELLASWEDAGNHPLDPHAIKATYPRRVESP